MELITAQDAHTLSTTHKEQMDKEQLSQIAEKINDAAAVGEYSIKIREVELRPGTRDLLNEAGYEVKTPERTGFITNSNDNYSPWFEVSWEAVKPIFRGHSRGALY